MQTNSLIPLIGMSPQQLRQVAAEAGLKPFAAKQMSAWLYQRRVTDIDAMTDLSKRARAILKDKYCIGREEPIAKAVSCDGTIKYLFNGVGDHAVEAVYIPDKDRATLCVSSQAGCRMNCAFCATGRQGFHGNLPSSRIINQILSIPESENLTNIVFMGMGEPTDNLDAVIDTIEILVEQWGLAWSPKRITVSTIGNISGLVRLLEQTKVHIAISVHSPFSSERQNMMPVEKAFPVRKIMETLRKYDFAHQRRLSVEYIMWDRVNDDIPHADALARLIDGTDARVNLIRFHPSGDTDAAPARKETMIQFRDRLNELGVTATIRASRGEDIDAACGMLAGKHNQPENLSQTTKTQSPTTK